MNILELSKLMNRTVDDLYQYVEEGLIPETDITFEDVKKINPMFHVPESSEPEHISMEEAAEISGLAKNTIYKKMLDGEIPYKQIGKKRFPYREAVPNPSSSRTRLDIVDQWMEEDPALRLHILQKYGIEEILFRLDRLERNTKPPEYKISWEKDVLKDKNFTDVVLGYLEKDQVKGY